MLAGQLEVDDVFEQIVLRPSTVSGRACAGHLQALRSAGRPVGEIAYGRGFSDAAHFSRAFRERFGCSPREWRQRIAQ